MLRIVKDPNNVLLCVHSTVEQVKTRRQKYDGRAGHFQPAAPGLNPAWSWL